MSRVFDRAGLVTRRLRGQGKGRCRGFLATRVVDRRVIRLALSGPYTKEELRVARARRKAHAWYMTADRRAA